MSDPATTVSLEAENHRREKNITAVIKKPHQAITGYSTAVLLARHCILNHKVDRAVKLLPESMRLIHI